MIPQTVCQAWHVRSSPTQHVQPISLRALKSGHLALLNRITDGDTVTGELVFFFLEEGKVRSTETFALNGQPSFIAETTDPNKFLIAMGQGLWEFDFQTGGTRLRIPLFAEGRWITSHCTLLDSESMLVSTQSTSTPKLCEAPIFRINFQKGTVHPLPINNFVGGGLTEILQLKANRWLITDSATSQIRSYSVKNPAQEPRVIMNFRQTLLTGLSPQGMAGPFHGRDRNVVLVALCNSVSDTGRAVVIDANGSRSIVEELICPGAGHVISPVVFGKGENAVVLLAAAAKVIDAENRNGRFETRLFAAPAPTRLRYPPDIHLLELGD